MSYSQKCFIARKLQSVFDSRKFPSRVHVLNLCLMFPISKEKQLKAANMWICIFLYCLYLDRILYSFRKKKRKSIALQVQLINCLISTKYFFFSVTDRPIGRWRGKVFITKITHVQNMYLLSGIMLDCLQTPPIHIISVPITLCSESTLALTLGLAI